MAIVDFSHRVRASDIARFLNQQVLLCGWIQKIRKLGNLIFIDLRDSSGIVQLVFSSNLTDYAKNKPLLTKESTIAVEGQVVLRKNINEQLNTGKYEIKVHKIRIFSTAQLLPLLVENETDALENVRLQYRYLDLRRPSLQTMIHQRAAFLQAIRDFLIKQRFVEVETPYFAKPTPEGARDYLVPTRLAPNRFYALSQSPQLYKQLLMIAGVERYFQIARCFRDEDLRSDRQPEHTQLDLEMAFVNAVDVQTLIEKLVQHVLKQVFNVEVSIPFVRIDYFTALNKYGSDKPDLRYQLFLHVVDKTYFQLLFPHLSNDAFVKMVHLANAVVDDEFFKLAKKSVKDNGGRLVYITYEHNKIKQSNLEVSCPWDLVPHCLDSANEAVGEKGALFFVGHNELNVVNKALGSVRTLLFEHYRHSLSCFVDVDKEFKFCWVVNWPLFDTEKVHQQNLPKSEFARVDQIVPAHNPFTKPQDESIKYLSNPHDYLKAFADSYDLVLNGSELGSGAVRNSNPDLQRQILTILGMSPLEIENRFGFLLNAYKYGAPPHAGIGIGVERWLAIMLHASSIRDVIAFPKSNHGIELMSNSPSSVDQSVLADIFIAVTKK